MRKISPEYSNNEVNRAGKILISLAESSLADATWAYDVMNNWRGCHDYPINTFQANLRKKIKEHGFKNALVVQRLKRVPSIISKLERSPTMNLSRMHDIGGLRAILDTVSQVKNIRKSFIDSRFRHKLAREYDYIASPKSSGYRGVHLVYRYYNNRAPEYDGIRIELQLRTKLQHAWATAVETMGTFLDHSLKSSEGPDRWLEFFSICGAAFAIIEKCPIPDQFTDLKDVEIARLLSDAEKELEVIDHLKAFGETVRALDLRNLNFKYYLLTLKMKDRRVSFEGFHANEFDKATERYLFFEKQYGDQTTNQIVLVSGDSLKSLKRAYPNYFLDTHEFIGHLSKYLAKFG